MTPTVYFVGGHNIRHDSPENVFNHVDDDEALFLTAMAVAALKEFATEKWGNKFTLEKWSKDKKSTWVAFASHYAKATRKRARVTYQSNNGDPAQA